MTEGDKQKGRGLEARNDERGNGPWAIGDRIRWSYPDYDLLNLFRFTSVDVLLYLNYKNDLNSNPVNKGMGESVQI